MFGVARGALDRPAVVLYGETLGGDEALRTLFWGVDRGEVGWF